MGQGTPAELEEIVEDSIRQHDARANKEGSYPMSKMGKLIIDFSLLKVC